MTDKKITALIIEDEAPIAMGLQSRLQRMGYLVCGVAFAGDEALKLIERYQPDVILADINLIGEIDGVEVITQVRATARTPVVYISAYPSEMVLDRLLETEPYEYLVKPIKDEALRNALTAALAQR